MPFIRCAYDHFRSTGQLRRYQVCELSILLSPQNWTTGIHFFGVFHLLMWSAAFRTEQLESWQEQQYILQYNAQRSHWLYLLNSASNLRSCNWCWYTRVLKTWPLSTFRTYWLLMCHFEVFIQEINTVTSHSFHHFICDKIAFLFCCWPPSIFKN